MTIQLKATEQYFPVVQFILLYKVVLIFKSVDEILYCEYSNESPSSIHSREVLMVLFWFFSYLRKLI